MSESLSGNMFKACFKVMMHTLNVSETVLSSTQFFLSFKEIIWKIFKTKNKNKKTHPTHKTHTHKQNKPIETKNKQTNKDIS